MPHQSVSHAQGRTRQASASVRIPLFAIALFTTLLLIHHFPEVTSDNLSKVHIDSWTSSQGVAETLQSDISGVARSRKLLQLHSDRTGHPSRRVAAAQSGRKVHLTAWELADAARDGSALSLHELRAVVDRFARLLSTSDSYEGDAALFLEEFEQSQSEHLPLARSTEPTPALATTPASATPSIQSI